MDFLSVYAGHYFHCAKSVIIIISMINACKGSISVLFDEDKIKKNPKKFYEVKTDLEHKYGDHIALLKLYDIYKQKKEKYDNSIIGKIENTIIDIDKGTNDFISNIIKKIDYKVYLFALVIIIIFIKI